VNSSRALRDDPTHTLFGRSVDQLATRAFSYWQSVSNQTNTLSMFASGGKADMAFA
jgi:hypothetical protein